MNTKPFIALSAVVSSLLLGATPSLHAQNGPQAAPAVQRVIPHEQIVWVRAQVTSVDVGKRILGLKTADGEVELLVDAAVQRLPEVKPGDWLDVQYSHAVALSAVPSTGIRERITDTATYRQQGGNPAGAGYITEEMLADVWEINPSTGAIRVRGASGRFVWLKVLDDAVMSTIKVGDQLSVRYRVSMVVAFQPANHKR